MSLLLLLEIFIKLKKFKPFKFQLYNNNNNNK
jgi:hypothetical protein